MNPIYAEKGYEQGYLVGRGTYGQAWVLRRYKDGLQCICKEVRTSLLKAREKEAALREADLLARMNHPNIVKYYDSFERSGTMFIVMEYAEGGSLEEKIEVFQHTSIHMWPMQSDVVG